MKFNFKESIDHVCKSIKNTPLRIYNGVHYQIFENFFSKDYLQMLQDVNDSVVKLEGLELQNKYSQQHRRRVSYAEPVSKNQPSTAFFDDKDSEKIYDIVPYKSNAGYCLYNKGPSWHGMTGKVVDGVRKSVFARFIE